MPFRFVHTADLHLDSPLRSLALRDGELAALIGDATRRALVAIVDLCLEERVDALVIAGDLYDGDQTSMKTARFLAGQMDRLHAAGIRVFIARGNHDASSRITRELTLPPNVAVFGGRRADAVPLSAGALDVVIHGLSFSQPRAPDSLLPRYGPPVDGALNIGVMHTSLDGAPGHDVYAPCPASALHAWGFDYWALGHIHARATPAGARRVVMAGMPQGRDINEAGAKSATLVSVGDDRRITLEERLTSIAQFERLSVDVAGAGDWAQCVSAIGAALEAARERTASEHLVARLTLRGASPLAYRLRRDRDIMRNEAQRQAERIGRAWIDRLEIDVCAPAPARDVAATPFEELRALVHDDVVRQPGLRAAALALTQDLLANLPAGARRFAGDDEAALEAFLDTLIAESGEDVLARLERATGEAQDPAQGAAQGDAWDEAGD